MAENHDIHKLFAEMRRLAVNPKAPDNELGREWIQDGPPDWRDVSGNCVCGVRIAWHYKMKNIFNGRTIDSVGSICIKRAIGDKYICVGCSKRFIDQVPRPAFERRLKETDWTCPTCTKQMDKVRISTMAKLARLNINAERKYFGNDKFTDKTEADYQWALGCKEKRGRLVEFIAYWELRRDYEVKIRANTVVKTIIKSSSSPS